MVTLQLPQIINLQYLQLEKIIALSLLLVLGFFFSFGLFLFKKSSLDAQLLEL